MFLISKRGPSPTFIFYAIHDLFIRCTPPYQYFTQPVYQTWPGLSQDSDIHKATCATCRWKCFLIAPFRMSCHIKLARTTANPLCPFLPKIYTLETFSFVP